MHSIDVEESASFFVRKWIEPDRYWRLVAHLRDLWHSDKCIVRECEQCAGVSADPFVAGDHTFYELAYGHTDRYPAAKWEFNRAIDILAAGRVPLRALTLLEIGAGRGAFLSRLIDRGATPSNLQAIEYGDLARGRLERLGLRYVGTDEIDRTRVPDLWRNGFDAIALFQVLEHLDDLSRRLALLRRCLRPRGIIVLAVPNPGWTRFNERFGVLDMPPVHISRFTGPALRSLAQRSDLAVATLEQEPLRPIRQLVQFHLIRYKMQSHRSTTLAGLAATARRPHTKAAAHAAALVLTLPRSLHEARGLRDAPAQLAVLTADGANKKRAPWLSGG